MIDPRAVVDPSAEIAEDVTIGPYSIIGPDVRIDSGTWVGPHVVINGPCCIGKDNKIFQFASIGEVPQDLKYNGEPTPAIIGDRNVIREYVTINRGTVQGANKTELGSDNLVMAYCHLAHDCIVGNHTIFSNGAQMAGHVVVEDYAIIGAFTHAHQFVRVGAYAFTGLDTTLDRDVPPFVMAQGNRARPIQINKVGLRRKGFSEEVIGHLHTTFRVMVKSRKAVDEETMQALRTSCDEARQLIEFIENSERGIIR